MSGIVESLNFNCCHCGKDFEVEVHIGAKGENTQLVDAVVNCSHCGESCKVKLYEHEVPTMNVYRGESSWTQNDIAQLKNQVFSTKPL
jgi:transcription elongation factor Elf1